MKYTNPIGYVGLDLCGLATVIPKLQNKVQLWCLFKQYHLHLRSISTAGLGFGQCDSLVWITALLMFNQCYIMTVNVILLFYTRS